MERKLTEMFKQSGSLAISL